jgi:hypothetical protein
MLRDDRDPVSAGTAGAEAVVAPVPVNDAPQYKGVP